MPGDQQQRQRQNLPDEPSAAIELGLLPPAPLPPPTQPPSLSGGVDAAATTQGSQNGLAARASTLSAMVAATATALKVVHVRTPWAMALRERQELMAKRQKNRHMQVYVRLQGVAYNFLERPTGWACFVYHFSVFVIVLTSLIFSILATIDVYASFAEDVLRPLEIAIMIIFGCEYLVRNWSAGCRSKYMGIVGRLRFAVKIMSIIDLAVVVASLAVIILGNTGRIFATSAIRVVRFLQILRIVHVDRQGGTWRLLGSVVYIHRQELVTTLYIGFLMLIFSSYFIYLVEKDEVASDGSQPFASFADALWWGIVTVNTVGYGDKVPQSWLGKMVASCLAMSAISFFALPSGILGSGFALKVQQKQRQKHFNRQIPAAASLIQASWRLYSVGIPGTRAATWKIYLKSEGDSVRGDGRGKPTATTRKDLESHKDFGSHKESNGVDSQKESSGGGRQRSNSHDLKASEHIKGLRKKADALHLRKGHKRPHQQAYDTDGEMDSVGYYVSEKPQRLSEDQKRIVKIIHLIKFHVARKKFQLARKPYDVRDVIEQYSQGHIDMMVRIKELQRRLDQTLGKPPQTAHTSGLVEPQISNEQQRHKQTITARLEQLEDQVYAIDGKLDQTITILLTLEAMLRSLHRSRSSKDSPHATRDSALPGGFRRETGRTYHRSQASRGSTESDCSDGDIGVTQAGLSASAAKAASDS